MGWSPKERWQITKIFVEVFVSGGFLIYGGAVYVDISRRLAIVVSRRSGREISLWKADDRHRERKVGGHCGQQ